MDFMGIKDVKNVEPILGADGVADGFRIIYRDWKNIKMGRKIVEVEIEKEEVKWVREASVKNDGKLHGFGREVMIKRGGKKRKTAASKKGSLGIITVKGKI